MHDVVASATYPPGSVPSLLDCAKAGLWQLVCTRIRELVDSDRAGGGGSGGTSPSTPADNTFRVTDELTGKNILHYAAARACPLDALRDLLSLLPRDLVLQRDRSLRTPLHTAAIHHRWVGGWLCVIGWH